MFKHEDYGLKDSRFLILKNLIVAPSPPTIWRYFEHQSVFNIELVKLKACVRFESRIKARSVQRAIKVKPP